MKFTKTITIILLISFSACVSSRTIPYSARDFNSHTCLNKGILYQFEFKNGNKIKVRGSKVECNPNGFWISKKEERVFYQASEIEAINEFVGSDLNKGLTAGIVGIVLSAATLVGTIFFFKNISKVGDQ